MIYPRLISSIKWKFDYVFFEKKKKMQRQQNILEQLCDKIVDVIGETFSKKYYFVKILQSKKGTWLSRGHKKKRAIVWWKIACTSSQDLWIFQECISSV